MKHRYRVDNIGSKKWPVAVSCQVGWLDANAYWHKEQIEQWLEDNGIEYDAKQDAKVFIWYLRNTEAATMFMLRWA